MGGRTNDPAGAQAKGSNIDITRTPMVCFLVRGLVAGCERRTLPWIIFVGM